MHTQMMIVISAVVCTIAPWKCQPTCNDLQIHISEP